MDFAPILFIELESYEKTDIKQSLSFKRVSCLIDHEHDGQLSPWKNLMPDKMMDIVINDTKGLQQVNEVSLLHYMSKISL